VLYNTSQETNQALYNMLYNIWYNTKNVLFNKIVLCKPKNNDSVNKFSLTNKLNDSKQKNQVDKKLDPNKKPTLEQLENVKQTMTKLVSIFF